MTMSPHDSLTMDRVTVCTVALITAVYSEQIVIIQPQVAPIKIIEKTPAKISCTIKDVQGSSTLQYEWSIGKQTIGRKSSILLTANRHMFDDGNLTCTVRNSSNVEYGSAAVAVNVQYPPEAFSQRTHRVFRGKDASICQDISGNPPSEIDKWKKVGVTSQWITSHCRLRQVNESHSGDYLFVMKNTMFDNIRKEERIGTGVQLVSLLVSYGARVMCPSNYTAVENTTAVLECHVDAYPRAVITWSREGSHEALLQTGSYLRIPHAQLSDGGNYTCTASNTISDYTGRTYKKEDSCIIHVIVKDGARGMCPSNYTAVENTTAVLECHVDAYPSANITWSREGSHEALPQTGSYLRIPHAQLSDGGNYTCTASNNISDYTGRTYKKEDSCIIHVIVKDNMSDGAAPETASIFALYKIHFIAASLGTVVLAFVVVDVVKCIRRRSKRKGDDVPVDVDGSGDSHSIHTGGNNKKHYDNPSPDNQVQHHYRQVHADGDGCYGNVVTADTQHYGNVFPENQSGYYGNVTVQEGENTCYYGNDDVVMETHSHEYVNL